MRGIKLSRVQMIFLLVMGLIFIIYIVIGSINNANYEVFKMGEASIILPKKVVNRISISEGESYVFGHSEDYIVLGCDIGKSSIDNDYLEKVYLNDYVLQKLGKIKSVEEIISILDIPSDNILDSGKTDKPSFENYYVHYKKEGKEIAILIYEKDNHGILEIMIFPEGDISKNEIIKMLGNMGYTSLEINEE